MAKPPVTAYFRMVHAPGGVKRVGPVSWSKEAAKDWVSFVKAAWCCRVEIRSMVITFGEDGKPDEKSRKRLSEEFNMDC